MDELAILGGPRALPETVGEKWERPIQEEKALISRMVEAGELTGAGSGTAKQFEDEFADFVGCRHALSFSQGTAALMSAYYAAEVGPGDEVITPAVGYIGSYAGALHMGARPIFCDISPESLLIDPRAIVAKITARTKAINIIHLNGRVCDLETLQAICRDHQLSLIDDASHAHGAEWRGKTLGNSSHITCFSLQGVNPSGKPIAGGEGGIACTNDRLCYQRMLAYCHLHRANLSTELQGSAFAEMDHEVLGLKWRAHPLAMALALVSLRSIAVRRAKQLASYSKTLRCIRYCDFLKAPVIHPQATMGGFYGGIKLIYEASRLGGVPRSTFLRCLRAEGIPVAGEGVGPLEYRRRLFQGVDLWGGGRGAINGPWHGLEQYQPPDPQEFVVAEEMNAKVFSLPCFIEVDDAYYLGLERALQKLARSPAKFSA